MKKLRFRNIKIVNSAVSFTDILTADIDGSLTDDQITTMWDKVHNYGNIRPGLINNRYAIKKIVGDLINEVFIDLDKGKQYPACNLFMINNNSRYDIDTDTSKLTNLNAKTDFLVYLAKTKHFIYIDNNLTVHLITKEQLSKLVESDFGDTCE